MMALI